MGRAARGSDHRRREQPMECPMPQRNDLSRSLVPFQQDGTLVAVVELSRSSWLVAGLVPGIGRHPLKKLEPDEDALLRLLHRWRDEAAKAGCAITRLAVAFEAGRDGFWLARWLRARDVEAHVIHPTSIAVSREHRRAKTDRLDTGLLKRAFLGWLRGEPGHCGMAAWTSSLGVEGSLTNPDTPGGQDGAGPPPEEWRGGIRTSRGRAHVDPFHAGPRLGRGAVAQGRVQALPVVEDLDILEHRRPGLRTGAEMDVVDVILLERGEEALHRRVIQAVAAPAHRLLDAVPP